MQCMIACHPLCQLVTQAMWMEARTSHGSNIEAIMLHVHLNPIHWEGNMKLVYLRGTACIHVLFSSMQCMIACHLLCLRMTLVDWTWIPNTCKSHMRTHVPQSLDGKHHRKLNCSLYSAKFVAALIKWIVISAHP